MNKSIIYVWLPVRNPSVLCVCVCLCPIHININSVETTENSRCHLLFHYYFLQILQYLICQKRLILFIPTFKKRIMMTQRSKDKRVVSYAVYQIRFSAWVDILQSFFSCVFLLLLWLVLTLCEWNDQHCLIPVCIDLNLLSTLQLYSVPQLHWQ